MSASLNVGDACPYDDAIETNADSVWSEDGTLDRPFDEYWDARSIDEREQGVVEVRS